MEKKKTSGRTLGIGGARIDLKQINLELGFKSLWDQRAYRKQK